MKRYSVKCESDREEFMEVLEENSNDLLVRVTRIKNGYEKIIEELMPRSLFELCLTTGYLSEIKTGIVSAA